MTRLLSFLRFGIREAIRGRRTPQFQAAAMPRIVSTIAKRPSHSQWQTDFFKSLSSRTRGVARHLELGGGANWGKLTNKVIYNSVYKNY